MALLSVRGRRRALRRRRRARRALLHHRGGQICALIGPNGAGKTTLFNVLSRLYEPSEGKVDVRRPGPAELPAHRSPSVGIARTFQNVALFPALTVLENVMIGRPLPGPGRASSAAALAPRRRPRRSARSASACRELLDRLASATSPTGRPPACRSARSSASSSPGRWPAEPRLLMLDEPANGLTHGEVDELGETIRSIRDQFDLTVLLVEHHMAMVMAISDHIVVLDFGRKIAEGPPEVDPQRPEGHRGLPGGARLMALLELRERARAATARCRCCTASTSTSTRARSWWCSAPTAPARPPPSGPSAA